MKKETKPVPELNDAQVTIRLPRSVQREFSRVVQSKKTSQGIVLRRAIELYIKRNTKV